MDGTQGGASKQGLRPLIGAERCSQPGLGAPSHAQPTSPLSGTAQRNVSH